MNDLEKLILFLKNKAEERAGVDSDDFNPYEYSGGNYDDAWSSGISDGEILLARKLVSMYGL